MYCAAAAEMVRKRRSSWPRLMSFSRIDPSLICCEAISRSASRERSGSRSERGTANANVATIAAIAIAVPTDVTHRRRAAASLPSSPVTRIERSPFRRRIQEAPAGLRNRLEHALRDVEVRVDLLDVVVLLERVHQAKDLLRRVLVRVLEREIAGRIAAPLPRRDDDRARELREELAALLVRRALLVLDRAPLAMSRHATPLLPAPGTARGCGCRP